ncbi:hypothetical protein BD310DRAFT_915429 [Dichomitus squalens]|uniref:Uncharacterized protein n=1 Tax=Dichomitus squalens TaxID=114155 RepID=A0A4V2K9J8_9APHY|nr:hypothetical protein BD310DRAFT_915429 [Dichomitus squalens]
MTSYSSTAAGCLVRTIGSSLANLCSELAEDLFQQSPLNDLMTAHTAWAALDRMQVRPKRSALLKQVSRTQGEPRSPSYAQYETAICDGMRSACGLLCRYHGRVPRLSQARRLQLVFIKYLSVKS